MLNVTPAPKKSGIYRIFNTETNKSYIGSSKNIYNRLHKHKYELMKNKHYNEYLQNAYNKSSDLFDFEVLEFCSEEDLFIREQFYIDKINPEYNICKHVLEYYIADESKIKISETLKRRYRINELQPTNKTKIKCFDLACNFIALYDSIKEASEHLKVRYHSIQKCLKKEFKQTHGFQFFYMHEPNPIIKLELNTHNNIGKSIYNNLFVYDLKEKDGYNINIDDLAKQLNVKKENIKFNLRQANKPFKQRYILIPLARIKLSELLGSPEEGNQQPSSENGIKVPEKVQRLDVEESTNNTSTSAEPFKWVDYEQWKTLKSWFDNHPYNLKWMI
jgi:hypothetical protein